MKIEMITPAGDPEGSPVSGGDGTGGVPDGANEFNFSDASTGVLTLEMKARVTPDGYANRIKDDVAFSCGGIGDSVMVRGSGNSNGKTTADGDLLKARVTFTGLPTTSAFGAKEVAVSYKQQQVEVSTFEVFYLKKETNHPGAGSGETPNWFYYWNQTMAGDEDHVIYLANVRGNRGAVNAMLLWDKVVVFDKSEIAVNDRASGTMTRGDGTGKQATGIDCFANVIRHEQGHVEQIAGADTLLGGA